MKYPDYIKPIIQQIQGKYNAGLIWKMHFSKLNETVRAIMADYEAEEQEKRLYYLLDKLKQYTDSPKYGRVWIEWETEFYIVIHYQEIRTGFEDFEIIRLDRIRV